MAKGWTRRLKDLFGKSSDSSEVSEDNRENKKKEKDGEKWEKEGDGEIVWAYFDVHKDETSEDDKKDVEAEVSDIDDDIILEETPEETSEEPQEEVEAEKKEKIEIQADYLADEIIFTEYLDPSSRDSQAKQITPEEKLLLELEKLLELLTCKDDFLKPLKIAYIKYIKYKYPFEDFSYLNSELAGEGESDEEGQEEAAPGAFEKVFMEMQDNLDEPENGELKGPAYETWEDSYYNTSNSASGDFFSQKEKTSSEDETVTGKTVSDWGDNSKYADFFQGGDEGDGVSKENVKEAEKPPEGDKVEGKKRRTFKDLVAKMASEEIPIAMPPPPSPGKDVVVSEFISPEDEKLDPGELIIQADKELELGWKDKAIKLFYKAAIIYKKRNNMEKALGVYEKLYRFDSGDINIIYSLGYICKEMGRLDEAKNYFRNVLRLELTHKETLFQLGLISFQEGTIDTALIAFKKVVSLDQLHLEAYLKLGELLEKKPDIPEAVKNYLQGAETFLAAKEIKNSVLLFKKVLLLEPSNEVARKHLLDLDFDPDEVLNSPDETEEVKQAGEGDVSVENETIRSSSLTDLSMEQMEEESSNFIEIEQQVEYSVDNNEFIEKDQEEEDNLQIEEDDEDEIEELEGDSSEDTEDIYNMSSISDCNLEDFIEEILVDYQIDPAMEARMSKYIELMLTSEEEASDIPNEIIFSSFMEDFIDDFDSFQVLQDVKGFAFSENYKDLIGKVDDKIRNDLRRKARDWAIKHKLSSAKADEPSPAAEELQKPVLQEEDISEIAEKPTEEAAEKEFVGIFESLSEEFLEDFSPGELIPYDEEEATGIGFDVFSEEDSDEEIEEIFETSDTREITINEEDLDEISEVEEVVDEVEETVESKVEEAVDEVEETVESEVEEAVDGVEETVESEVEEAVDEVEETVESEVEEAVDEVEEAVESEVEEVVDEVEEAVESEVEEVVDEVEETVESEEILEKPVEKTKEEVKAEEKEKARAEVRRVRDSKKLSSLETISSMEELDVEIKKYKIIIKENIHRLDEVIDIYKILQEKYPSSEPLCCAIGSAYIKKGLFVEGLREFIKTINEEVLKGKENYIFKRM